MMKKLDILAPKTKKTLQCEICGKWFALESGLRIHQGKTHGRTGMTKIGFWIPSWAKDHLKNLDDKTFPVFVREAIDEHLDKYSNDNKTTPCGMDVPNELVEKIKAKGQISAVVRFCVMEKIKGLWCQYFPARMTTLKIWLPSMDSTPEPRIKGEYEK